jgi:integrase/recombinase XerD
MMKHHRLYTSIYQELLQNFSRHINRVGYQTSTKSNIISCVKEFLHWMEQQGINQVKHVKPVHIKAHYKYLNERPNLRREGGLSSSIVTFHIYAIRLFLTYLQKENIIKADPMGNLTFERVAHKEREILTQKEIQKLYKASETLRDKAMLSLLYGLGLRSAEASGLDIMDIHFASRILYVRHGKGDKSRDVPMAQQVAEHLKDYYHNERGGFTRSTHVENAFILNNHGRRAGGQWMWLRLKYLTAKAGIEGKTVTLHTLRHSIATHLLENGMSIEYVKNFLGHASLGSTQIYTHIVQKHLNTLKI